MNLSRKIALLLLLFTHFFSIVPIKGQVVSKNDGYPSSKDLEVYPNPAQGKVKIFFRSPLHGQGYISLQANNGVPISRRRVEFLKGNNYWDQNLPNNHSSQFWIEIRIDSIVRKVMVHQTSSNNPQPH
jgi:hypothetical protein